MKATVISVNSFGKLDMKTLSKSITISYIVTASILVILSLLVTFTSLPVTLANIGVILTAALSTFIGGFIVAKKIESKGFLNGGIAGLFYVAILYTLGIIFYQKFSIDNNMIIMLAICLFSGSIGGIVGVNAKKKK